MKTAKPRTPFLDLVDRFSATFVMVVSLIRTEKTFRNVTSNVYRMTQLSTRTLHSQISAVQFTSNRRISSNSFSLPLPTGFSLCIADSGRPSNSQSSVLRSSKQGVFHSYYIEFDESTPSERKVIRLDGSSSYTYTSISGLPFLFVFCASLVRVLSTWTHEPVCLSLRLLRFTNFDGTVDLTLPSRLGLVLGSKRRLAAESSIVRRGRRTPSSTQTPYFNTLI